MIILDMEALRSIRGSLQGSRRGRILKVLGPALRTVVWTNLLSVCLCETQVLGNRSLSLRIVDMVGMRAVKYSVGICEQDYFGIGINFSGNIVYGYYERVGGVETRGTAEIGFINSDLFVTNC